MWIATQDGTGWHVLNVDEEHTLEVAPLMKEESAILLADALNEAEQIEELARIRRVGAV